MDLVLKTLFESKLQNLRIITSIRVISMNKTVFYYTQIRLEINILAHQPISIALDLFFMCLKV